MAASGTDSQKKKKKVDGREQRGDRTAQALIQAARAAFARGGYAGASVREIARAAGANPALVRYHFGSKEGLYHRVIDEAMEGLRDRLVGAFELGTSLQDRAEQVTNAYLDYLASDRDFPKLVMRAVVGGDPGVMRVARNHLRPMMQAVGPLSAMVSESELGSFEDTLVTIFAAAIVPFLYGPLLEGLFDEDVLSADRLERRRHHLKALSRLLLGTYMPQ